MYNTSNSYVAQLRWCPAVCSAVVNYGSFKVCEAALLDFQSLEHTLICNLQYMI